MARIIFPDLEYKVDGRGVCTIALARHDGKANALNQAVLGQLREAFTHAGEDDKVEVIVLKSAQPVFCAGIDIAEMSRAMEITDDAERRRINTAHCRALSDVCAAMQEHCKEKPIIGVANGKAVGSGVTLLTLCDHVIADMDNAQFSYPETRFNMMPWVSIPYLLNRMLPKENGLIRARKLLATGDAVDAFTAKQCGLVDEYCPPRMLNDRVNVAVEKALVSGAHMKLKTAAHVRYADPAAGETNNSVIENMLKRTVAQHGKNDAAFRDECVNEWAAMRCAPETLAALHSYKQALKERAKAPLAAVG